MNLFSTPTQTEWLFFVLIFVSIGLFIGTAEFLRHKFHGSPEVTRKLVHILTGVLIFFTPSLFTSGVLPMGLAVLFIVINFAAIKFGLLKGMHGTSRYSYGTVYYPLSFLILIVLFWNTAQFIISVSILILAFSDAAAAIVGENLRSPHEYFLTSDKKSYEGSATMFAVTFSIIFFAEQYCEQMAGSLVLIPIAVTAALFVTLWEAISSKGFDNLTVPLSAAFMLHYFFIPPCHDPQQMFTAVLFAALIAGISIYYNFLSPSGSVATFLLATIIFGIGGWEWTIPILTFFIASSLLSKIGKAKKQKIEAKFDKTDKRDEGQVAANGGIAGIIILLWYFFPEREYLYLLYLATLAAATADTWGTEIGTLMKQNPFSIVTLKSVEPGTSGGVSLVGLVGGIGGASLIVLSAWIINREIITATVAAKIIFSGIIGSIIDSILGATLQAQYQTEDGRLTEKVIHYGKPTILIQGLKWIDNDMVNWACAFTGAITMYFLIDFTGF